MSPVETVDAYFVCLDTENWSRMRTLWCTDCELRAVGARPRSGLDEVIGYFSRLFTPWSRHRDLPTRLIRDCDTIVAEVAFTGTTPDGRQVSFDAIDVFDLQSGRIRTLSNWYDLAYVRRVLDDPPDSPTRPEPLSGGNAR
ncbi:MAG TPA: nuclear transport factor 2 family protein [Solirubrobacteraceae bacterium]